MGRHTRLFVIIIQAFVLFTVIPTLCTASTPSDILIKNIRYEKKSGGILIEMSRQSKCEAIHIDGNAILVAVKNGVFPNPASATSKDDQIVTDVSADKLPGDILALVIKTQESISSIQSDWLSDGKSLLISIK